MEEAGLAECSNVVGHGELTVEKNAKVVNNSCKPHPGVRQSRRLRRDLVQLLTSAQPDELCLVFVHFQAITGHPVIQSRIRTMHIVRRFLASEHSTAGVLR